ncbi:hypothetical protein NQ317_011126 [Molorchus minor]|uniref:Uncharacterized protein n=1 Tax=Molorchus minor TaxID=1323400 RepID=A0ABQ9K0Y0_9CUCU|nr:hypothetical protein NQ317_011126 [Molorchus minor]
MALPQKKNFTISQPKNPVLNNLLPQMTNNAMAQEFAITTSLFGSGIETLGFVSKQWFTFGPNPLPY